MGLNVELTRFLLGRDALPGSRPAKHGGFKPLATG
jgi:hypothetical protein